MSDYNAQVYSLIWNPDQIKKFQDLFVKNLDEQNVKVIYLAARRKYDGTQPLAGSTCFNRQIVNRATTDLFELIQRYQVPVGTYKTKGGEPIRQDALVVYFLLNPWNTILAYGKFAMNMSQRMVQELAHKNTEPFDDILSELTSCIHSSPGEKIYVELDIDTKDPEIVMKVLDVVRPYEESHTCTVETHGGYHIIMFRLSKEVKSRIWQEFNKPEYKFEGTDFNGKKIIKSYVDLRSDPSPPIPGTLQGGFPVCFVELDDLDPSKGKWMYNTDMDYKNLETEPWQDFPVSVSEEFKREARMPMASTCTVKHDGVRYKLDYTIDVALVDGKRVKAKYVDYIPMEDTYEADIVDNLINAGGGAEKKNFLKVLELSRLEKGRTFNLDDAMNALEVLKAHNWVREFEQPKVPGEWWLGLDRNCLAIKNDLEHGRKSFQYREVDDRHCGEHGQIDCPCDVSQYAEAYECIRSLKGDLAKRT